MTSGRSLDLGPLFSPRSIAVVGASQRGGRATGAVRNLLEIGYKGEIYPVNPKYSSVLGLPCYPDLRSIGGPVDLVAVGIPSEQVLQILEEAHRNDVRAAVIFASGFAEAGEVGRERQRQLEGFANRTGMLICGPNCLGTINLHGRVAAYSSVSPKEVLPGSVGVVSQSGTVVVALVRSQRAIGFSYLVSSGNEAVVTSSDYLRYLAEDPNTGVLAAFIEGFRRPHDFLAAAEAAFQSGKPLLVVKAGRSAMGGAATAAHTGSLAGSYEVERAVFRQTGVVHCDDLNEWLEAMEVFRQARPPRGDGVGVIGISGGENALVMDHASAIGLRIPPLSEGAKRELAKLLPWYARPENPLDPTGAMVDDTGIYRRCLEILASEPELHVIAVSQDSPAAYDVTVARLTAEVARQSDKCFVFFNNFSGPVHPEVAAVLRDAGVPYLQGIRESLKATKALIDYHQLRREPNVHPAFRPNATRRASALRLLSGTRGILTEDSSKQVLGLYGFAVVPEILAESAAAAEAAAEKLGYPVVAKVLSPDLAHKAAAGGVRLNLKTPGEVRVAFESIRESIAQTVPAARVWGVLVQSMLQDGIEVVLGVKRDPQFGPTVLFGLGGIFVEAIRQFALRLAPLTSADAQAMVREVPAFGRVMERHSPDAGSRLIVPLLLKLSDLATELRDEIEEIDINPVILLPATGTATVVDALFVSRRAGQ